jgi:DNA polymerase-3 subunit gamma/tau
MAYQVLARKWRPKSFDLLVGQAHVVRALCNALDNQRLHHAYLLTGTRGVGKTTIARIMGKALNCETGVTSTPCGNCEACVQIDNGRFVDLLEIDAASNTGIDNIREVLENAQYAPTAGRFKIYIIDEVHMLSKSAFNAMLKTLEEPPPHVKFILATTDPHKVPVTVLSRCLQFSLKQMTPQLIAQHLASVLATENIPYEPAALTLLSHAAAGSMRDALSLLDQAIAHGAGQVEEEGIRAMLGAVDQRYIFDLLYALKARDGLSMMQLIDELHLKGIAFEAALAELLHVLHQIALAQVVPTAINEDTPHQQEVLAVAQALSPEDVQLYYQIALHGRRDLSLATDDYAGFSMTCLRMLAFAPMETSPPALSQAVPIAGGIENRPSVAPQIDGLPTAAHGSMTQHAQKSGQPPQANEKVTQDALDPVPVTTRIPLDDFQLHHWAGLVNTLKGMSMMLAQNSALISVQENVFTLHVASQNRIVADRMYQDKLRVDLSEYFNVPITLVIDIEEEVNDTPLRTKERIKDQRQAEAEMVIQQDAFVQNLITEFGATIVPNSIKPIE